MIEKLQNCWITKLYLSVTRFSNKYLFDLLVLFMRLWMAQIFWYSGLTKIANWKSTIYLFKYEYAVPLIDAEIAAMLATATELSTPILLILGIATRFAAIPMLIMTAVIQFTYLSLIDHLYWASFLGTIILYGAGKYSIDRIICRYYCCPRSPEKP